MSDTPQGPGWWQASDGRFYPPDARPGLPPPPANAPQQQAAQASGGNSCAPGCITTILILVAVAALVVLSGGGDDDDDSGDNTASGNNNGPLDPTCRTIDYSSDGIEAVAAVEAPADIQGRQRWYIASATGGLWVVTTLDDSASGTILPLNNRARSESILGIDARPDAPVFGAATADSGQAIDALACAQGAQP